MKLYNLKDHNKQVTFIQAVKQGLGTQEGLFFPLELPEFESNAIDSILEMDFISRSSKILSIYIGNEISEKQLFNCVKSAFIFPVPIKEISNNISCLELFYGPTLSFKDFGARFMAQIFSYINTENDLITILTATSGDTGAAVAHAFYKMKNIRVVILYPKEKITLLQEKLFCTLGENIKTIAINGNFDTCQSLVKRAFNDSELKKKININSANSINISRLLAQICYYFEAVSQLSQDKINQLVISIPSGNFGNLTAGLLAKSLGLPIKRFILATNANDTIPRFLKSGIWKPYETISTLSNSMDISNPNNWPRVEELFRRKSWKLMDLGYGSVSDDNTKLAIKKLDNIGYISEPHAAISWYLLQNQLNDGEYGLFLGTAHPAKFLNVSGFNIKTSKIPESLTKNINLPTLSFNMNPDFVLLRQFLLKNNF